jgi:hypothetical protein
MVALRATPSLSASVTSTRVQRPPSAPIAYAGPTVCLVLRGSTPVRRRVALWTACALRSLSVPLACMKSRRPRPPLTAPVRLVPQARSSPRRAASARSGGTALWATARRQKVRRRRTAFVEHAPQGHILTELTAVIARLRAQPVVAAFTWTMLRRRRVIARALRALPDTSRRGAAMERALNGAGALQVTVKAHRARPLRTGSALSALLALSPFPTTAVLVSQQAKRAPPGSTKPARRPPQAIASALFVHTERSRLHLVAACARRGALASPALGLSRPVRQALTCSAPPVSLAQPFLRQQMPKHATL